jgi:putative transcriptional regulator
MPLQASLANHLLVAMPSLADSSYAKSVIYVCEHHVDGTVGLMINRPLQYPMQIIFDQLHIEAVSDDSNRLPILFGGPVQPERGFVIHRPFGDWRSSLAMRDGVTITTSSDIIRAIAANQGPKDVLVTLGYMGWKSEQLDEEVINDVWLVCPFTPELLYDVPFDKRWEYAGSLIGVNMNQLVARVGHA